MTSKKRQHNLVMQLKPIGIIHSPHKRAAGTPIQSVLAAGVEGTVEIFCEFAPGLRDLDGFERIWLVYWFDRAAATQMMVTPYLDTVSRGLFATRAPARPNPIGLSSVRLLGISGHRLHVDGLDILDNTPLLDIKPYVPAFDAFEANRIGWLVNSQRAQAAADDRFESGGS